MDAGGAVNIEDMLGRVARIESLLRALGGVGRGLADLTGSLGDTLPLDLREQLVAVRRQRNRMVHRGQALTPTEGERLAAQLDAVEARLQAQLDAPPVSLEPGSDRVEMPEYRPRPPRPVARRVPPDGVAVAAVRRAPPAWEWVVVAALLCALPMVTGAVPRGPVWALAAGCVAAAGLGVTRTVLVLIAGACVTSAVQVWR